MVSQPQLVHIKPLSYYLLTKCHHTVFTSFQSKLGKLCVRIMLGADNDKLDQLIREEILRRAIVLCLGVVDSAVRARLRSDGILRRGSTLEKRIDLQIWVGQHVGEMEEFC